MVVRIMQLEKLNTTSQGVKYFKKIADKSTVWNAMLGKM